MLRNVACQRRRVHIVLEEVYIQAVVLTAQGHCRPREKDDTARAKETPLLESQTKIYTVGLFASSC